MKNLSVSLGLIMGGTGYQPVAAGYQPAAKIGRQVASRNGLVARSTLFRQNLKTVSLAKQFMLIEETPPIL